MPMTAKTISITTATDKDAAYILGRLAAAERHDKEATKADEHRNLAREARLEAGQRLIEVRVRFLPAGQKSVRPGAHLPGWYSWLDQNGIARETARNLMRDAERTEEQRDQQRMAERERKRVERGRMLGWRALLVERLGITLGSLDAKRVRAKMREAFGQLPGAFRVPSPEADAFVQKYITTFAPPLKREPLPERDEAKVKRAIDIELASLRRGASEALESAVRERTVEIAKDYGKLTDEARVERERFEALTSDLRSFMTLEEYRLILNCLHPDRAPEDRRERFAQAFAVMKRVGKVFD